MQERLQKIIAQYGGVSRRAAERFIEEGTVTVNGLPCKLGDKADPETDEIYVNGERLITENDDGSRIYIMLNKPVGYVTTMSDEKGRKTVRELVADIGERVYPVGRLDINSEGLLLMTNDGDFANYVMHPKNEKEKTYKVLVSGDIESGIKRLREPMELDGVTVKAHSVKLVRRDGAFITLDIVIHEGRNRQIRRMCDIAGLKVHRLTRTAVGNIKLGKLPKGTWRYLTEEELDSI